MNRSGGGHVGFGYVLAVSGATYEYSAYLGKFSRGDDSLAIPEYAALLETLKQIVALDLEVVYLRLIIDDQRAIDRLEGLTPLSGQAQEFRQQVIEFGEQNVKRLKEISIKSHYDQCLRRDWLNMDKARNLSTDALRPYVKSFRQKSAGVA